LNTAVDLAQTLSRIASVLSSQKIPFHLTGGLASSYYGEPRFTQDVDIVVSIATDSLCEQFIEALAAEFLIDPAVARDAIKRRGLFQALDEETLIKVDLHVGESIPGELQRSKIEEVLPGVSVPLVSKEDAIIAKLLWLKKGSHKSRQDILMMLKRKGDVDSEYLEKQAIALDVQDLLHELQSEV